MVVVEEEEKRGVGEMQGEMQGEEGEGGDGERANLWGVEEKSGHKKRVGMASVASAKSWVKKVRSRTGQLREAFGLDEEDEQLLDTYMCALKKKILLQGRMYVFDRHVCFSCSLFGYHKLKVIPIANIVDVKKRKNVGFPNSIRILWKSEEEGGKVKKEFFTSFLSRQEAFRLIRALWEGGMMEEGEGGMMEEGPEGRPILSEEGDDEGEGVDEEVDEEEGHGEHVGGTRELYLLSSKSVPRINDSDQDGGELTDLTPRASTLKGPLEEGNGDRAESAPSSDSGGSASTGTDSSTNGKENKNVSNESPQSAGDVTVCNSGVGLWERQCEKEADVPSVRISMQKVLEYQLPVDPKGFYSKFLSSESDFFYVFHSAQGHVRISLTEWQDHEQVGPVRELSFVTSLKGFKIGPPEAMCHQTQRFKVYRNMHIVFETSQAMSDIPYGDHFKVETRWDIKPHPDRDGFSSLTIHIGVPFTKNTMWKRFIEKGVTGSLLEAYQMFRSLADAKIAEEATQGEKDKSDNEEAAGGISRRQPEAPEDLLPRSKEDWEMMLSQVEPKFRGGLWSLRKMQESLAVQNKIELTKPQHRRRTSLTDNDIFDKFDPEEEMISRPISHKNSNDGSRQNHASSTMEDVVHTRNHTDRRTTSTPAWFISMIPPKPLIFVLIIALMVQTFILLPEMRRSMGIRKVPYRVGEVAVDQMTLVNSEALLSMSKELKELTTQMKYYKEQFERLEESNKRVLEDFSKILNREKNS